ncbi:hypothetical protein AGMMS4952_27130 [Spirochaetia bacterium]|nr:hypothetical protein AGMMS4952_27130 [Spirochaetia bacterium]
MRRQYTLYKETNKSGTFWYARFWDESLKKYAHSRSTGIPIEGKRERRYEAEKAADALCAEFAQPQPDPIAEQPKPAPVPKVAVSKGVADTEDEILIIDKSSHLITSYELKSLTQNIYRD